MTLARWNPPQLISGRMRDQRVVDWLELFYDLIYVAALIQLGQSLVDDLSVEGIGRFVVLFTLLWWAWTGTTFLRNRIEVDDLAHRGLVISQMLAIGALAVLVDDAFGEHSAAFALAYFFIRLSLVLMYARVWRHIPHARPLAQSFLIFNGISTALWLLSVAVPPPGRFWLWGIAFLVDVSWLASPRIRRQVAGVYPPDPVHMTERFALFTLIVLGESIIKIIGSLADHEVAADTLVHGALAFIVVVALWWTYFDDVADSPIVESEAPLATVWTFLHLPLTMGLTATGVSLSVLVLADISALLASNDAWFLIGAVIVALGAVIGLDTITRSRHFGISARQRVGPRIAATALLVLVGVGSQALTTTSFLALVAIVIIGQIAVEILFARRADRAMRVEVDDVLSSALAETPCDHLSELGDVGRETAGCVACTENGLIWVHLRHCTVCGQVGCCDDSPGRHAAEHFLSSGHPTMRSMEPGESWAWCYVDRVGVESASGASGA
jgi:low temperature requirement protein LtrA